MVQWSAGDLMWLEAFWYAVPVFRGLRYDTCLEQSNLISLSLSRTPHKHVLPHNRVGGGGAGRIQDPNDTDRMGENLLGFTADFFNRTFPTKHLYN